MYHPFLLLKKRRAFKYKWRTLHLVCWNVFHFNVLVLFRSLSNFAGWPFKNKSLLCKHCDKLAFLIAWKIYFRRNSCRSKQNILSWVMNMKVWIHLRDHFDYHKLIETKNEKLINYAPHHHMFLYLQIIISSEAANLDILGFYTGPERYFCRLFEFAVDLNENGHGKAIDIRHFWRSSAAFYDSTSSDVYMNFSYHKPTLTKQINQTQFSCTIWFKFRCFLRHVERFPLDKREPQINCSSHVCLSFPPSSTYANTPQSPLYKIYEQGS